MKKYLAPILVIALLVIPFASFVQPAAAQAEKGPAADHVIWKAVPLQNAVQALTSGDIDVYLFGLRPSAAQQLVGKPGIALYQAPAGLVDIGLNPAPVMIVQLPGKVSKAAAAQALGVDPVVISAVTYIPADANLSILNSMPFIGVPINKTDVTIVELCAKPASLPGNVEVLWQSDKYDINPFCFRDIRFALNYAIDRDYIVKNIYKGLAIAKYTFYGPDDPVYTELIDIVAKYKFSYNPDLAKSIVSKVLAKAGAEQRGEVWYYNGKPIQVIGIIRVEDERHEIGLMFANALEQMGIQVIKQEVTFTEAIPKVYYTDPRDFEWHFYTEGWGKGAIDKWDPWNLAQFAAAWLGWSPGWFEPSYWNYRNYTIDYYSMLTAQTQINADQLKESNYVDYLVWIQKGFIKPGETIYIESKDHWISYLRRGTELGLLESIRIWIVATMDTYAARSDVKGVTLDLGAGLRNPFFYRGMYKEGSDTIRVGHLHVFTAGTIWDPVGGFSDVYSVDPMRATYDPWIWRHPFNGEPIPFRVTFSVETAGPTGKLQVPDDAVWWDAKHHKWVLAKELGRTEATSKVVFDLSNLIGTHWHDGETITCADIVGYYAELLDLAYNPTKSQIEGSVASQLQQSFNTFVAFRFLPGQKKIEVYLNYWHFDPNYIADYAVIAPSIPVPLLLAEDYLAFVKKTYALSDTRSEKENIPHINLVLKNHAEDIAKALDEMKFDDYKSWFTLPHGKTVMTPQEWSDRVSKIKNYIKEYGVAWISQGPFKLVRFDKDAQELELEAFRDPAYPFGPKKWVYGLPVPTEITSVVVPTVVTGQDAQITIVVKGLEPIHVIYIIRDPATGEIVLKGMAQKTATGYIVKLPGKITIKLKPNYVYELEIVAYSEQVALPAGKTALLQTLSPGLSQQLSQTQKQIQQLQKQLGQQAEEIQQLGQQVQQLAQQLGQLQQQLGQQVAQVLQQSLTQLANTISKLSTSTAQGFDTVNKQIKTLSDTLASVSKSVSDLDKKVSNLQNSLNTLATKDDVNSVASKASSAASKANAALWVSVINLILLLVVIALLFRKA
ncbi:hypothetical protein PYJP_10850 [Pyrofollis japonicus]|uniref:ABC transporter substrate-binding protein n=1 Tax=Pyrofollis japonicus TaxID=3060460 RepID=UPI00295BF419|nr:ABC transporter substrate-binding protein [Pyrofollis japonicus]BEP17733.1 hypothetical protein PYJP_10850 [Pyrofollis japonicus]